MFTQKHFTRTQLLAGQILLIIQQLKQYMYISVLGVACCREFSVRTHYTCSQLCIPYTLRHFWGLVFACHQVLNFLDQERQRTQEIHLHSTPYYFLLLVSTILLITSHLDFNNITSVVRRLGILVRASQGSLYVWDLSFAH